MRGHKNHKAADVTSGTGLTAIVGGVIETGFLAAAHVALACKTSLAQLWPVWEKARVVGLERLYRREGALTPSLKLPI